MVRCSARPLQYHRSFATAEGVWRAGKAKAQTRTSTLPVTTANMRPGITPVADEVNGAAHVDVHKVDARVVLDQLRAARQRVRVAAADLRAACAGSGQGCLD